jgi:hypothetical protein
MKAIVALGLAAAWAACVTTASAEELKSGLQVGDFVGAFDVEKCAGIEDGVKVGQKLCYR